MASLSSVRRYFPHTKKHLYFNVASSGPLPQPAYRIQDAHYQAARDAVLGSQPELFETLDRLRANAAKLFGARRDEVGFGFNTTFGLNIAAFGLPLKRGDEVILSDVEFPANVYPWLALRDRGVKIKFVGAIDGFFNFNRLADAITKKTKVVALSFVQYHNGFKIDVAAIGKLCRDYGIVFVLDCMQGAGCEPMNLRTWNVDIASAGGQKWLLGAQGSGLYYISESAQKILKAPWCSWLSIDWQCNWSELNDFSRELYPGAQKYELGSYPAGLVHSLDWSLNFLISNGIKNIQEHNHNLIDMLIEYLLSEPYYRITSSLTPKHRSSILSFTTDYDDIASVYRRMADKGITASLREGAVRVSIHLYNNKADLRTLIKILQQIARSHQG